MTAPRFGYVRSTNDARVDASAMAGLVSREKFRLSLHQGGLGRYWQTIEAHDASVDTTIETANNIKVMPLYLSQDALLGMISWRVGGTGDAAVNADFGLYTLDGAVKVVSTGSVAIGTASTLRGVNLTITDVPAGVYLAAWTSSAATGQIRHAPNLPTAGIVPLNGTLAGGGATLPATITPTSITTSISANFWLAFGPRGSWTVA